MDNRVRKEDIDEGRYSSLEDIGGRGSENLKGKDFFVRVVARVRIAESFGAFLYVSCGTSFAPPFDFIPYFSRAEYTDRIVLDFFSAGCTVSSRCWNASSSFRLVARMLSMGVWASLEDMATEGCSKSALYCAGVSPPKSLDMQPDLP